MDVVSKGILNGVCGDTDFGFLVTDIVIGDLPVCINCAGGLAIGRYRKAYQKVNEHHIRAIPYQIKITMANVRLVDGRLFISANYVLCEE